jgi:hypothetical protein
MGLGDGINTNGVVFNLSSDASSPTGSFFWVQVINSRDYRYIPEPQFQTEAESALDSSYPYANGNTVGDSPEVQLVPANGEMEDHFIATMYLMWKPQADTTCSENCTVEVALGSVQWAYINDGIETLDPTISSPPTSLHGWVPAMSTCTSATAGTYAAQGGTMAYPKWTNTIANSN